MTALLLHSLETSKPRDHDVFNFSVKMSLLLTNAMDELSCHRRDGEKGFCQSANSTLMKTKQIILYESHHLQTQVLPYR